MRPFAILYFCFALHYSPARTVPIEASALSLLTSGHGPSILRHPATTSNPIESLTAAKPNSTSRRPPTLQYFTIPWPLTPTLSLHINVGPWKLSPARILACLTAANHTVYKKVGPQLLDRKFRQEEGSRINTLLFEIGPAMGEAKRLTWAHVALVLGMDGLPEYFVAERYWTSVYFEVVDSRVGKIGEGAVRKWYQ
ncbi:MAG: hypothetical protein Q9184_008527 [Pyrenodesmia sp. 2 TL-2023]